MHDFSIKLCLKNQVNLLQSSNEILTM